MIKTVLKFLLMLFPLACFAREYKLEGKIGDKYAVVIELIDNGNDTFSGRYAYKSTLKRDGNVPCSWLTITPDREAPQSAWTVRDCKGNFVEEWYDVHFNTRSYLTARMKNVRGKVYDVVATAEGAPVSNAPLDAFLKQHIGDMVCDFDMFNDSRVQSRLQNLMGIFNYLALKDIYQVQGSIEYHAGMCWGSGFMAHRCCDPAAIWAYETANNSFYVWIRKDGQEYWWSESGEVPMHFRFLVEEHF